MTDDEIVSTSSIRDEVLRAADRRSWGPGEIDFHDFDNRIQK
jgi:hypothetical protein